MANFNQYLTTTGEVGFVDQILHSVVYVAGLPHAKPYEFVLFESGEYGQVLSLSQRHCEVLLFSHSIMKTGTKVVRTGKALEIGVGQHLLGCVLTPFGYSRDVTKPNAPSKEFRLVDHAPLNISGRTQIQKPLASGVLLVDSMLPLAAGQRELIIGDRKTGKTSFLLQVMRTQVASGAICIYAAIGKKNVEIKKLVQNLAEYKIQDKTIVVASASSDPAGSVFITPYSAMTIAEYFQDLGHNVIVIMDDLTTHARYYREINLLAKRFPGKNSYPGDIFYVHARLLERAGSFEKGTITAFPVVETTMGQVSGFIQTNVMAITDGHLYFDQDLFNQGRRPAINPYLSVTRVGHQAQSPMQRDVSARLSRFLAKYKRMKEFSHFSAELDQSVQSVLAMGNKITTLFDQSLTTVVYPNISFVLLAMVLSGMWRELSVVQARARSLEIMTKYAKGRRFYTAVNNMIASVKSYDELVEQVKAVVGG